MAKKRANITDLLNDLTFSTIFDKFKMLSMNSFRWEGLPDGICERHIERNLFSHGKAIFFRDPDMSFMCLECQEGGRKNVYGDPLDYRAYGHGYNRAVNADDCVIIENNIVRAPTEKFLYFFVNKLTEAERTMDVNVKAVKTPYIVACDDKDILSFKRIFQQIDGNVPAIFADRALNLDAVQVFQTGAKFLGNELMDYKRSVEGELLTFLGVNNSPIDKKERLVTDEANSNNQLIESFSELQLQSRQKACKEINEKFGLSLSVSKRPKPMDNQNGGLENDSLRKSV